MIFKFKKGIRFFIFLFMVFTVTDCTQAHREKNSVREDVFLLKPAEFPSEIERLEDIAKNHSDPSVRAKAYLQLAMLYSSCKNPSPNYQQALKKLEVYISLDPSGGKADQIQDWLTVLQELDRMSREQDRVNDENRKIKQKIGQLMKENKELKDAMEQLKHLDINIEEKRKKIK